MHNLALKPNKFLKILIATCFVAIQLSVILIIICFSTPNETIPIPYWIMGIISFCLAVILALLIESFREHQKIN